MLALMPAFVKELFGGAKGGSFVVPKESYEMLIAKECYPMYTVTLPKVESVKGSKPEFAIITDDFLESIKCHPDLMDRL